MPPVPVSPIPNLDDRYRIERVIGEGGMATVYLAEDLKHQRKVAIKVLRPELAAAIGVDRFLAEIKTTAALFDQSRELAEAESQAAIVTIATRHIGLAGRGTATMILTDDVGVEDGAPRWPPGGLFESTEARVAGGWAYSKGEAAGNGTRHLAAGDVCVAPIRAPARILGVVAVRPDVLDRVLTDAECATIQALADQAALALELGTTAQRWETRARGQARTG